MPRLRRRHAGAALTAAALLIGSSACGSRVDDEGGASAAGGGESCVDTSGDSVKIGLLNSMSGTMSISETTVRRSLELAVEEINADGGVLGKQLEGVTEDGASEPTVFAERATKLIQSDCVAAVFGGWTSSSRKAMLPVFESNDALLFYPVQYEGLEASENIFYTGATTNQQIIPALDYLKDELGVTSLHLVGSDYVFPRTANAIIKAYARENGIEIVGEDYEPLGSIEGIPTIVNRVQSSGADAVFNTLNGDSNVSFFTQYANVGLDAATMPVLSVSIAEEEVPGIGVEKLVGQYTAWNYYQTVGSPQNQEFVAAFKEAYGEDAVTSDPMEAAYTSVYLWKGMVEAADSFDVGAVQDAADGVSFEAPEGPVTVNGDNHHIAKTGLIGQVNADGLIDAVWSSDGPIEPDPCLEAYPWAASIEKDETYC
jgi:urea transport system substrate-binding protein